MKLKVLPILFNILGKIDIEGIINKLRNLDIFDENQTTITESQKAELGLLIIAEIVPQLGKISDDIIPLVSVYKGISEEAAAELDVIEVFKEIFSNKSIMGFLSNALQNKVGQVS